MDEIRSATPRDERGASAVEYGLLIAGIAAMIVVVVFAFGGGAPASSTAAASDIFEDRDSLRHLNPPACRQQHLTPRPSGAFDSGGRRAFSGACEFS